MPGVAISEDRLLREFLTLVQIDSPTSEEGEIARVLERALAGIGFSVVNDGTGPSTGNLIARLGGLPATGRPSPSARTWTPWSPAVE